MAQSRRAAGLTAAAAVALALAGTAAACGNQPGADVVASWAVEPSTPSVGAPTRTRLTLMDARGRPIGGADVQVEAHMSHPGMAPVVTAATERADGVYEAEIELTMAGGWTVVASGTLPDGRRLMETHEISGVR